MCLSPRASGDQFALPTAQFLLKTILVIVVLAGGALVFLQHIPDAQSIGRTTSFWWFVVFGVVAITLIGLLTKEITTGGAFRRGPILDQLIQIDNINYQWIGPLELRRNETICIRVTYYGSKRRIGFISGDDTKAGIDVLLTHGKGCTINTEICDHIHLCSIPLAGTRADAYMSFSRRNCLFSNHFIAIQLIDSDEKNEKNVRMRFFRSPCWLPQSIHSNARK